MNKNNFFLILLPFLFIGCAFKPHKPVTSPVRVENGSTQVKVRLHNDDKTELGTIVGAYAKTCIETVSLKGFAKTICSSKLLGEGKITKQLEDKVSLVEFDPAVEINDATEFEVK